MDAKGAIFDRLCSGCEPFFENIHARTLLGLVASLRISGVESRQLRKRFDA
jgi:hypothetical protein